ncbi:COG3650 family protein [Neotabrizicola sp. VNH66]|uniref:COG3650 family protein n=1 Tax=Neotabrizicola sp. VNH66 TaxID=3400918 RepID=UPI003C0393B0
MIRAAFAVFLMCSAAQAEPFPAAYQVQGVAADDVLNIRAEPSASAPVLGALGPFDINVEVLRLSEDGKWGLVSLAEGAGWVAMRFLRATPPDDPSLIPRPFRCVGTEPFWSLTLPARGGMEWSTPDTPRTDLTLTEEHVASQGYLVRAKEGTTRIYSLTVTREWCSDGMSDREFGFLAKLFIEQPDGNLLLSGCCTLDAR